MDAKLVSSGAVLGFASTSIRWTLEWMSEGAWLARTVLSAVRKAEDDRKAEPDCSEAKRLDTSDIVDRWMLLMRGYVSVRIIYMPTFVITNRRGDTETCSTIFRGRYHKQVSMYSFLQ